MKKEIQLHYKEYDAEKDLPKNYKRLINEAKKASNLAYAAYSNFKVGAAVLLDNEEIITGNNQENAAYPSGLCAERVATFYANATYPNNTVIAIAIAASNEKGFLDYPITPCGACRQVLLETEERYDEPITIILYGTLKIQVIPNAKSLLPFFFNKAALS